MLRIVRRLKRFFITLFAAVLVPWSAFGEIRFSLPVFPYSEKPKKALEAQVEGLLASQDLEDKTWGAYLAGQHGMKKYIVGAPREFGRATPVANPGNRRLLEAIVVAGPASHAREATDDALNEHGLVHPYLDHAVDTALVRGQDLIQRLGLGGGARHAVEDDAALLANAVETLGEQRHDDVVRHQPASIDHRLGLSPYRGARGHRLAQHVTRRQRDEAELLLDALRLGTLAGARRPKKDQDQRPRPLSFAFLINPSYWCASRCDCT